MLHIYDCECLGPFDALMMLDDHKNVSNILAACFIEEFEFESMKKYLLLKTSVIHKCRSKLVKIFGLYWFKRMDDEEFAKKQNDVVVLKEGIHNDKGLTDFMEELQ